MAQTPTLTLPSGTAVYNRIMSEIDPDLLTDVIPTLNEKYKNESAEEKSARLERYKASYAEYEKRFAAFKADLEQEVARLRREALKSAEAKERAEEEVAQEALLAQMTA